MARTIERRRTTTTTRRVSSEGADQLKQNISTIADELTRVRDQARQEVDSLERIRGMLDVGYLNELISNIEALEERMEEIEREALQSRGDAEGLREELEQEQERLAKLWDAYKTQEDELNRVKRDYPLMEEKLFDRERTIDQLRAEISRLEPLSKYKGQFEKLADEVETLEEEIEVREREIEKANRTIRDMEDELGSLREVSNLQPRVDDLERQLEEERERLAKLYRVYEDLESEKKDFEDRIMDWESWFAKNRAAFEAVCKATSTAPA